MFASFFPHFGSRKLWPSISACLIIAWHHPPACNLEEKTCHSQSDTHCTQNLLHQLFKDYQESTVWSFSKKTLSSRCVCAVFKIAFATLVRVGDKMTSRDVLVSQLTKGHTQFPIHFPPAVSVSCGWYQPSSLETAGSGTPATLSLVTI